MTTVNKFRLILILLFSTKMNNVLAIRNKLFIRGKIPGIMVEIWNNLSEFGIDLEKGQFRPYVKRMKNIKSYAKSQGNMKINRRHRPIIGIILEET
eukprot:UN04268